MTSEQSFGWHLHHLGIIQPPVWIAPPPPPVARPGFKRVWKNGKWEYYCIEEQPDVDFHYDKTEEVWRWDEDPTQWDQEGDPDYDPFSIQKQRWATCYNTTYVAMNRGLLQARRGLSHPVVSIKRK